MIVIKCACCGYPLNDLERAYGFLNNRPPACEDCRDAVDEEADKDLPMWPSDWYGHAHLDKNYVWVSTPDSSHV